MGQLIHVAIYMQPIYGNLIYWLCSFSNLDRSRSIYICQTRSILSGEKERADLSGHSERSHLVLICTVRRRPRPLLKVNKVCWRPAAQMGVAKSDFHQMRRI